MAATASTSSAITVSDNFPSLAPSVFNGKENAKSWLSYFKQHIKYRKIVAADQLAIFGLLMRDIAHTWFSQLDVTEMNMESLEAAFLKRFGNLECDKYKRISDLFDRSQRNDESVQEYTDTMQQIAASAGFVDQKVLKHAIIKGFKSHIRTFVFKGKHGSLEEVVETARLAEFATGFNNDRQHGRTTRLLLARRGPSSRHGSADQQTRRFIARSFPHKFTIVTGSTSCEVQRRPSTIAFTRTWILSGQKELQSIFRTIRKKELQKLIR